MDIHPCPGGCGRPVAYDKFACVTCWYKLPWPMRAEITRTWRMGAVGATAHATAMAKAWAFLRERG